MNTLKMSPEEYLKLTDQTLTPVSWCPTGFYYNGSREYSKNPLYHAGLYYIQEPSAMFPAQVLPVEDGDFILDMCAAPGGKSTALAAKLKGTGLLVSNDISASRAKALLKNIEASGVRNSIVLTEDPKNLAAPFEGYFDKILIDAPCSGEGMFRKEPSMMKAWEKNGPDFFAKLQREIVDSGIRMLKAGGMMVYSTCTFSVEENEGTLKYILDNYPEMHVVPIEQTGDGLMPGHPEWVDGPEEIGYARRLWPHHLQGEGHFTALLKKDEGPSPMRPVDDAGGLKALPEEFARFLKEGGVRLTFEPERLRIQGDHLSYLPENSPPLGKLRRMRTGWYLGDIKKKRFEPSGFFARGLEPSECDHWIDLELDDARVIKYLKCETLDVSAKLPNGWYIVGVCGHSLGWGKVSGGTLKNKYPSGWRWQ
jgi:NOL1/NOP2/sun family putative RNA methylase